MVGCYDMREVLLYIGPMDRYGCPARPSRPERAIECGCALAFRRTIAGRVQCRLDRCLVSWHVFLGITAAPRRILHEGESLSTRDLQRVRRPAPCPNGITQGVMLHPPARSVRIASKIRAPHFHRIHHRISPNPTPGLTSLALRLHHRLSPIRRTGHSVCCRKSCENLRNAS